jgi:3-oxoacyl-(acyl-carrier-protein) synthase
MKIIGILAAAAVMLPFAAEAQTAQAVAAKQPAAEQCGFFIAKGSACAVRNEEQRAEARRARIAELARCRTSGDTSCTAGSHQRADTYASSSPNWINEPQYLRESNPANN